MTCGSGPIRQTERSHTAGALTGGRERLEDGAFGARMAAYLGGDDGRAVKTQTLLNSKLVVTGLRCDRGLSDVSTPIPAEKAFIISLHLRDLPFHELRLRDAVVHTGFHPTGGVSVFDLGDNPRFFFPTAFHCLHFYVRRATLDSLADDQGARRIDSLSWPHGDIDHTVTNLGSALLPALNDPGSSSRLFLDHVVLALNMHFACVYGGMRFGARVSRGKLAPWQERRCKELMESRLGEQISVRELASECRLSDSHFATAFRRTTGESPHRWLMKRRVENAKEMLLSSEVPLSVIALDCGFADQSHLTRVFTVMVGAPPGVWRRARMN
jgi:AraC family transcriptional regulator